MKTAVSKIATLPPEVYLPCISWLSETTFRLCFGTPTQILGELNAGAEPIHTNGRDWVKRQSKLNLKEKLCLDCTGSAEYLQQLRMKQRPLDYVS